MTQHMAIQFVFFDAAGTLIDLAEPVGETYARVASDLGLRRPASDFQAAFGAAWRRVPLRPPLDGPRPDDDREWWRQLVAWTLEALPGGADALPFEPYFERLFRFFGCAEAWRVYPEVPGVLEALRGRGFRLGVLSNFDGRLDNILAGHGLDRWFEFTVISSRVGADKPHPEIFRHAVRRTGLRPEICLHVGDQEEIDKAAAARAGLVGRQVARPGNDLRSVLADLLREAA